MARGKSSYRFLAFFIFKQSGRPATQSKQYLANHSTQKYLKYLPPTTTINAFRFRSSCKQLENALVHILHNFLLVSAVSQNWPFSPCALLGVADIKANNVSRQTSSFTLLIRNKTFGSYTIMCWRGDMTFWSNLPFFFRTLQFSTGRLPGNWFSGAGMTGPTGTWYLLY